jgi:hypothetical protein
VADADIISTFWDGMTYRTLVHELSHEQPKTTKETLDTPMARRWLGPLSS